MLVALVLLLRAELHPAAAPVTLHTHNALQPLNPR
jgi:hypothetical protein